MFVCVRASVCACVWGEVHICVKACMSVCICAWVCMCIYTCECVCTCECVHMHVFVCVHNVRLCVFVHGISVCICMFVRVSA